mgnify:CR=1 FL=1
MDHKNKYRTLLDNTFLLSLGTFGSKILTFVMVRFYTGVLTPSDYGTADLIMQTANLLLPVVSLGITNGVFRFALDRKEHRKSIFSAGLYTILLGPLILLAAGPLLSRSEGLHEYVELICAYTLASCLHSLCAQYIRAEGKTALFAGQGIFNTALVIWFNILFLQVFRLGVFGYVMSVVVADGICTGYLVLREKLWKLLVPKPDDSVTKAMLRYSIPLIPATIFWWITSVSDRYMVTWFLGTEANGLYAVACKIPTILSLLSTIFMEAWQFSAISEATGDREVHIRFYGQVWSAFLSAMVMAGSVLIVLCRVEIRLLSAARYFEAWKYVPVLSIAMVFSAFASFMGSVYVVTEKSRLSFRTTLWGALANILLNLLLIPRIGIQGAAIATLASYVLCFSIRAVSARKLIPFPLRFTRLVFSAALLGIQILLCFVNSPIQPIGQIAALLLLLVVNRKPFVQTVQQLLHLVKRRR